jgi:putrescine aminotransferase
MKKDLPDQRDPSLMVNQANNHTQTPKEFRRVIIEQQRQHVNLGLARLADLVGLPVEVRSIGNYVFDEQDQKYLDCGGYGVFMLGHCHPAVVAAVKAQLERHPLSTRALVNAEVAQAAEALAQVAPKGLDYVYFGNSGAEATEFALKLACLNGKTKLIAMHNGFHGKTLGALSVTGRTQYRAPFQVWLPEVDFIRFGDAGALESVLLRTGKESCVILEPVQAEGGVVIPPTGYLRDVEMLCRRHDAFFILDEVQTGLGRLGYWWGAQREEVVPDVLLAGKALSGGVVPISAVIASSRSYKKINQDPYLHTSTFGGNPLAATAACTTIGIIKQDGLVQRARELGEQLIIEVKRVFMETCPRLVRDVRGLGLLIAIEFEAKHLAADLMIELLKRKVLISWSLNAQRVLRLTPPALLTTTDVALLLAALRDSAQTLNERYRNFVNEGGILQ